MTISQSLPFESDSGFEMILSEELFSPQISNTPKIIKEEINKENFFELLDKNGTIMNEKLFKQTIFTYGCTEEIKPQIWKFLLKFYSYSSTFEERLLVTNIKIKDYQNLKFIWKKSPDLIDVEYKRIIDQDINRLDRFLDIYKEDESHFLTMAKDILITYSIYHPEVGYCQGMSDLLSPILETLKDESISFWCFVNLMEKKKQNFKIGSKSIEDQLTQLLFLMQSINPQLAKYFKDIESLYLCYRWILVCFKREFEYKDVKRIWEILWTDYLSSDYLVFMLYSLLSQFQDEIIDGHLESYEILSLFNRNSMKFDLKKFLDDSMTAYYLYEDQFDIIDF
eukprot:gene13-4264_t